MPAESALCHRDTADFGLIETMRWEPATGFLRLERHLSRLSSSADALGLPCDLAAIRRMRGEVDAEGPLRVRLLLGPDGTPTLTTHDFASVPDGTVWRLAFARTRLSSGDPLLRHKTTRRAAYEAARAEFAASDVDEVILLNERGEVCEGTITTVFVDPGDGGPLLTPPLQCGLLAGVLRAELLESGTAVERVLVPPDLANAGSVFVGNALRGLIPARVDVAD